MVVRVRVPLAALANGKKWRKGRMPARGTCQRQEMAQRANARSRHLLTKKRLLKMSNLFFYLNTKSVFTTSGP